ncbi:MAG: hypothetical protein H6977_19790 [Gammaproteobacteria bacterium]|nr:hypothetical protein [Gammaproteobacteria bacterium]MCP5202245.1 hypothetical protein [Gammaproteobacteria bacterium]
MAGEFDAARQSIADALTRADGDPAMSADVMEGALLNTLLTHMARTRSRKDLASLIEFQLESVGEDEFVITRGC